MESRPAPESESESESATGNSWMKFEPVVLLQVLPHTYAHA